MKHLFVYTSLAVEPLSPKEMEQLLAVSRRNNAEQGITGLLLHQGDMFIQLLEGPIEATSQLLKKIAKDPRHKEFRMIHQTSIEHERYSSWEMAYSNEADVGFGWTNALLAIAQSRNEAEVQANM